MKSTESRISEGAPMLSDDVRASLGDIRDGLISKQGPQRITYQHFDRTVPRGIAARRPFHCGRYRGLFFGSHHGELPSLWPVRCGKVVEHRVAPLKLSQLRTAQMPGCSAGSVSPRLPPQRVLPIITASCRILTFGFSG